MSKWVSCRRTCRGCYQPAWENVHQISSDLYEQNQVLDWFEFKTYAYLNTVTSAVRLVLYINVFFNNRYNFIFRKVLFLISFETLGQVLHYAKICCDLDWLNAEWLKLFLSYLWLLKQSAGDECEFNLQHLMNNWFEDVLIRPFTKQHVLSSRPLAVTFSKTLQNLQANESSWYYICRENVFIL